jgi:periplasmic divalent cation tolerance protein
MQPVFLYITADTPEEAERLGRTLVEERLAACVNILGGISSFYWWEGAVQQGTETALIAKTRADLTDAVTERIKTLHGYSCPCVVSLPVNGGNPDFLAWLGEETRAPATGADKGNAER